MERVRRSVWDLDGDSQGQKTLLRLEAPVQVTTDMNKGKGLVFNFEGCTNSPITDGRRNTLTTSSGKSADTLSQPGHSSSNSFATTSQNVNGSTGMHSGFVPGSSGTKLTHAKKRRRPNQWKKKAQAMERRNVSNKATQDIVGEEGLTNKRKAVEESEVSSKIAKRTEEKVVLNEEPPKQI